MWSMPGSRPISHKKAAVDDRFQVPCFSSRSINIRGGKQVFWKTKAAFGHPIMKARWQHGNNYIGVADIVSSFSFICNVKWYSASKWGFIYFFLEPAADSHRRAPISIFTFSICQQVINQNGGGFSNVEYQYLIHAANIIHQVYKTIGIPFDKRFMSTLKVNARLKTTFMKNNSRIIACLAQHDYYSRKTSRRVLRPASISQTLRRR